MMLVTDIKTEFEKRVDVSRVDIEIISDTEIIVYMPFGSDSVRIVLVDDEQRVELSYSDAGDWEDYCVCSYATAEDLVDELERKLVY